MKVSCDTCTNAVDSDGELCTILYEKQQIEEMYCVCLKVIECGDYNAFDKKKLRNELDSACTSC